MSMRAFARWLKKRSSVTKIDPSVTIVLTVRDGIPLVP